MTKRRSTKSALISAILVLAMCFSALVGTTFAWFTDSVTSSGNIIQTGTLKVGLYYAPGSEEVPTALDAWTNAEDAKIFNNTRWEPGYVEARHIKIANEGSLALKYQLAIKPSGDVSALADVIDVYYYADGAVKIESRTDLDPAKRIGSLRDLINTGIRQDYLEGYAADTATLVFSMQDEVGNEYQGLSIGSDFSVVLLATQYTSESDSFDNQYDKDAWITGMQVYTATDLQAALNAGESVTLMNDIELDAPITVSALIETYDMRAAMAQTIDLNGHNITARTDCAIINNGSLAIVGNGEVKSATTYGVYNVGALVLDEIEVNSIYNAGSLTVIETIVDNSGTDTHAIYHSGTDLTIDSGTFTTDAAKELIFAAGSNVAIKGGSFTQEGAASIVGPENAGIVVSAGEFNAYIDDSGKAIASAGAITLSSDAAGKDGSNCSFNFNPVAAETEWVDSRFEVVEDNGDYILKKGPAYKIGNAVFYEEEFDSAVAAWTNGTTLTLTNDVTLEDVIVIKSTEHHILNLGSFTMTAASGKHAIEITCDGRSSASYALTVNADETNPGGIKAPGKSCIYYKKSGSTKDRPIILINNGVFSGSYSVNFTSNGNTNCPQLWVYGGTFNSYMNLTKCLLKTTGGTFNAAINCTGDTTAYRQIRGGSFKSWQFMTADAVGKFFVGDYNQTTKVATYDVGVYVDDNGYLVVGGPVITENDGRFAAHTMNYTKGFSSYLKYSSAATYGLYFTSAEVAAKKVPEADLTLFNS